MVIIGSGAIGIACAYYLNQSGIKQIVVLEQNSYLGGHSTSRCAGGIRHQFGNRLNIRLSKLNMQLLEEFALTHGDVPGLQRTGYMFILESDVNSSYYKEAVSLQNEEGIASRFLESGEVKAKLPFLEHRKIYGAAYYHGDGLIDAGNVVNKYTQACIENGVRIFTDTRVTGLTVKGHKICAVHTDRGDLFTGAVINAAGPWAGGICAMAGQKVPVSPVKQQLFLTEKLDPAFSHLPVMVFPDTGLGIHMEGESLLSGLHREETQSEPMQAGVDVCWEMKHCRQLLQYMPSLRSRKIQSGWHGFYDCTPDGNPIIGDLPGIEGLFCIFGFNGHGFMHSAACGKLLAEHILNGAAGTLQISDFSIERFHNRNLMQEEKHRI